MHHQHSLFNKYQIVSKIESMNYSSSSSSKPDKVEMVLLIMMNNLNRYLLKTKILLQKEKMTMQCKITSNTLVMKTSQRKKRRIRRNRHIPSSK